MVNVHVLVALLCIQKCVTLGPRVPGSCPWDPMCPVPMNPVRVCIYLQVLKDLGVGNNIICVGHFGTSGLKINSSKVSICVFILLHPSEHMPGFNYDSIHDSMGSRAMPPKPPQGPNPIP